MRGARLCSRAPELASPRLSLRVSSLPASPAPPLWVSRHQLISFFSLARSWENASWQLASDSERCAARAGAVSPEPAKVPAPPPACTKEIAAREAAGAEAAAGKGTALPSARLAGAGGPRHGGVPPSLHNGARRGRGLGNRRTVLHKCRFSNGNFGF